MKLDNNIKSRYLEILIKCKVSKRDFCKEIGFNEKNFNRFMNNKSIKFIYLEKIENLGINSRWLSSGTGKMYNNTKNGYKIKYLIEKLMYNEENFHYKRLIYWIKTHFDSIEDFENKYKISEKNYFENISLINQIPGRLVRILSKEGLNILWLYNFKFSPYLNNEEGNKKKYWLLENKNSDNLIYLEYKGII